MQLFSKPSIAQLQILIWVSVFIVMMLTLLQMDSFAQSLTYATLNTAFYALIIYGNILVLFPRLYQNGNLILYILAVVAFILAAGLLRGIITISIYNEWFAKKPEQISIKIMANFVMGGVLIFLLSFIFRIALEYFKLKSQTEDMLVQKTQAELNLLKSQVQPHFLFNTLNNIYYEAYLEAPRTAGLIERLSDIMRYFVDESPKQEVSLGTEIQFLENYIGLEKIRIRYEIEVTFNKRCETTVSIPPMLLMTFVENIFKHGIDKTSSQNKVELSLTQQSNRLNFTAVNTLPDNPVPAPSTGFGIDNLRKRLVLLYKDDFDLQVDNNGKLYTATLSIPLA